MSPTGSEPVDEELTLLLVLKDRPEYTARWLAYANVTHFPFPILIADGGERDDVAQLFASGNPFSNLKVQYVRYPPDLTLEIFYSKVADALDRVTTPYVVRASNDDFYSVTGMRQAAEFLRTNPDFSTARGRIFSFSLLAATGDKIPLHGKVAHFEEFKAQGKTLASDSAQLRVEQQCGSYVTIWHDVHRTSQLREFQRKLKDWNPQDLRMADLLTDLLAAAAGKVLRGSFPYMLRQANPSEGMAAKLEAEFPRTRTWVASDEWKLDAERLAEEVAAEVIKGDNLSLADAHAHFSRAFRDLYIAQRIESEEASAGIPRSLATIARSIVRNGAVGSSLRAAYRFFAGPFRARRIRRQIEELSCSDFVLPILKLIEGPRVFESGTPVPHLSHSSK